ncbi:MAG: SURF1 family protein [Clostridia bacterium]
MASGYSLRPRPWPLLAGALFCAAGIALGQWQAGRAAEKRALAAQLAEARRAPPIELSPSAHAPELVHRRVGVRGTFDTRLTMFLDNKLRGGRPGYEVVTPMRLARSDVYVLVNRGWVAAPARRDVLPDVPAPSGELRIEGLALERFPHAFEMGQKPEGPLRQNVTVEDFVAATGLPVKTVVVEQETDTSDGLAREWPAPDTGVEKHESYALQWYSLATLAAAMGLYFSFRRA